MLLNTTFFCLLFLCTCKPQSANLQNDSKIAEEYLITYKNGMPEDTVLKSKKVYDPNGSLLKEINYYKKQILKTIIYLNNDSLDLKSYLSKSDSIFYSVKGRGKETKFYNGKLVDEVYYDKNNNIVKETNYNINSDSQVPVEEEFFYLYDGGKKKISETFLWNKDTIHKIKYTYNKDSLLVEKYYLLNKCCEGNQPIPADKILYEYSPNKNLIKEVEVIDRNIRRKYKDQFKGYYNKVSITIYSYDNQNRLIDKKIYIPNFSENPNTKIDELYTVPSSMSEEYIYKYK